MAVVGTRPGRRRPSLLAQVALVLATLAGLAVPIHSAAAETPGAVAANPFEDWFASEMERLHVPGAVFVLVDGGEITLARGYGYADLQERSPADPEKTVFRIASISKLFTSAAVMQLHERGRLSLDEDVNLHLDEFRVDDTYPEPIRVAHLLTHTEGFEARITGLYARTFQDLLPLGDYLAINMPRRTLPPGEFLSYGNFATVLAGYLVERASGMPFDQYMKERLFRPLAMHRSGFERPLPPEAVASLAVAYAYEEAGHQPQAVLNKNIVPAGGMYATAEDVARFMAALLGGGQLDGARVLKEETVQQMFERRFGHHPGIPGTTYGFLERFENGRRGLVRDGDGLGRSRLLLVPEEGVGFFVAYNLREDALREELTVRFMDHFFPSEEEEPPMPDAAAVRQMPRFEGDYRPVQFDQSTYTKIQILFATQNRVTDNSDGTLTIEPLGMGDAYGGFENATRWLQIEPLLFRRADGKGTVAFGEDSEGRITHMFSSGGYLGVYEKIPWYQTNRSHLLVLGLLGAVFLSAAAAWPVARAARARGSAPSALRLAPLAGTIGLLNLAFAASAAPVIFLIGMTNGIPACAFGLPPLVNVALVVPLVTTALTAWLTARIVLDWWSGRGSVAVRAYYSLVAVAAVGFIPLLAYWKLLGLQF